MTSERIKRTIETLLGKCEEAAHRGDWAFVLDTAKRVLRMDPEDQDANAFVQMAEDEQGTPEPSRTARRAHGGESRVRAATERLQRDVRLSGVSPAFSETAQHGPKATTPTLFVVYSSASEDEEYKQALKKHLRNLKREGVFFFNPPDFPTDDDSRLPHHAADVAERFSKADVILLLVSPDYLDAALQEGPKKLEYDLAFKNLDERRSNVRVVPVILRSCSWDTVKELCNLEAMPPPRGETPVKELGKDAAFTAIARWLERLVRQRKGTTDGLEKRKRPDSAMHISKTSVGALDNDRR
jgi:hypothetical protein